METKNNVQYDLDYFYDLGLRTIRELESEGGILASARTEAFGCIFGRDSLITALKLLEAYDLDKNIYYLCLTKRILEGLIKLQGKEINIESGEEPGKCIHEFRATAHEHLTKQGAPPWYTYPDGTMRNFDSIDSTPLFLIVSYRYIQKSGDLKFINESKRAIDLSLEWIFEYGDENGDGLIDYQKKPERKFGGLVAQNWTDSAETLFHEDNLPVDFPIAPIEAQAYTYLALKLWSAYFKEKDDVKSLKFENKAKDIKGCCNRFITGSPENPSFAYALDNQGRVLVSKRSNVGHILWSALNPKDDGFTDCLFDKSYISPLVKFIMEPDIFEPEAGIRTLSAKSRAFGFVSYHNGTIWPHDNSLIAQGMDNLGYKEEARMIRRAVFHAYEHFKTPLELFVYQNGLFQEYSAKGQTGCRLQAWSAASMIADSLAFKKDYCNG